MTWTIGNSQSSPGTITTDNITSVTLTAPTGIANGDLLHAAVAVDIPAGGDPGAISLTNAGSGAAWTKISDHYTAQLFHGSIRLAVFRKIAASESGNYTASWTTAGRAAWGIVDIQGASATSTLDVSAIANSTAQTGTVAAPALTGLAGSSDLEICTFANPGGGNYTVPAGMTKIFSNGQTNTDWVFLCMAYQMLTSNASTSTQTLTTDAPDIYETSSVAYQAGVGSGGGGGSVVATGADSFVARSNALMILLG